MTAKRDRTGRLIRFYRDPATGETAQWMTPNHPARCANPKCWGITTVDTRDVACLVKRSGRWSLYHAPCAPSWTYQPANEQ